ncbi:MAG: 1-deoxy-D-xylulose-5-phosphate synthase [Rickettsiales endosymbiont of Dermacentor nuttalli]
MAYNTFLPHSEHKRLLDMVNYPQSLKKLSTPELELLCQELRTELISIVAKTGGHLGAGLGVIELTIALHYIFDTPNDILLWDTGHQSYPHKILTGRKHLMHTLRQENGISGFVSRSESVYDNFGTGHSSTSISAALGMAVGRDLKKEQKDIIAVIGDGALSAGLAYEAMNNAGSMNKRLIVILNDNDMSISKPVGALSTYLSKLISSSPYLNFRNIAKQFLSHLPKPIEHAAKRVEQCAKTFATDNNFFEEMGFYYIGPLDGHNLEELLSVLKNIKEDDTLNQPVLIHVLTEKGKGFHSKEDCKEKFHAVSKFDPSTGIQQKSSQKNDTYTQIFAKSLIDLAKDDDKIVAITAAMPSGTGLNLFAEKFPNRMFDVGIAEQHAVTFAAGLACEGLKPFVTIYSTFLQRAFDQIVHDVALQKLPVRFAIDRAGLVGSDGPTHAGSFDISFLNILPNFIIMAASDENELKLMVNTAAVTIDDTPCAFRYPRGEAVPPIMLNSEEKFLQIGKGRIIRQGTDIAILSLGTRLRDSLNASEILVDEHNISTTVADARFAKPLDYDLIKQLAKHHKLIITIEEGSIGGFGNQVLTFLSNNSYLNGNLQVRTMHLPDKFIEHNHNIINMYSEAGLNSSNIVNLVLNTYKK